MMADSALMRESPFGRGQLDEDVLEARARYLDPQYPADPAKMRDEIENAAFLLAHGNQRRILRHVDPKRVIGGNRRLERIRNRGEGDRDLVQPSRQHLQRVDIAARGLAAGAQDEDVVAELFRLAENLRGQHDRPAARRLLPQPRHHRSFQERIHSGRELIEKHHRRVDHEHLGDLHAAFEPPLEVHDLAICFRPQLELIQHVFGPIANGLRREAVKSAEGGEVVEDREEQIGGALLNDNRNAFAHFEGVP
jgi:hypothetical protein